jgi:hypothetical protein
MSIIKFKMSNSRTQESAIVDDFYWFEENYYHNVDDNNDWIIVDINCKGIEKMEA